jgi:cobalt-zinc-cadmium efflux system protein
MGKGHAHANDGNMRRVLLALYLTSAFMLVEVAGGILSGSLTLLADAGHMLTDSMALALAAVAFRVSRRPPDARLSYGYQRFQMLAAFGNGLCLLLIVGWILVEAFRRLLAPSEVEGLTMLGVATAGLLVNLAAYAVLHGGDRENLNMRGAALHVAGDLLGSVAAILAALVILQTGWMPIDPILSVFVAILIAKSAWLLVKRSAHVLLEGAPDWLNVVEMQQRIISAMPAVEGIHHVHVWGLTPQDLMLTMHLRLAPTCSNPTAVIREVKGLLETVYGIGHSTIEVELDECSDHSQHVMHDHPA